MYFRKLKVLTIIAFLFAFSDTANAMSCMPVESRSGVVKEFPIIFKGEVVSTHTVSDEIYPGDDLFDRTEAGGGYPVYLWAGKQQSTQFKVIESYKGNLESHVNIFHQFEGGGGIWYYPGETYIIFAKYDAEGRSATQFCDPKYRVKYFENKDVLPSLLVEIKNYKLKVQEFVTRTVSEDKYVDFYLEQINFYESNGDYPRAEHAYKVLMEKNFDKFHHEIKQPTSDRISSIFKIAQNKPYAEEYARMIFLQERYAEVLDPLDGNESDQAKRLRNTALVKLKRFTEIDKDQPYFSGIEIDELDVTGADLQGADFSNSKIKKLIAYDADLSGADLSNAKITIWSEDARFENSNFSQSNLKGYLLRSSFQGANFSGAKWHFSFIDGANFTGADFSNAKLVVNNEIKNTDMSKANFEGAYIHKLSGANTQGANLNKINRSMLSYEPIELPDFSSSDLSGYDLSNGNFRSADFRRAKLVGTDLSNADFSLHTKTTDLRGADLTNANLSGAKMYFALYDCKTKFPVGFSPSENFMIPVWLGCKTPKPTISFKGLKLPHLNNGDAGVLLDWRGTPKLKNINLGGADFDSSDIRALSCESCNLRNAVFSNIRSLKLSIKVSDMQGVKFKNIDLDPNSSIVTSNLRGADFSGVTFVKKQKGERIYFQPDITESMYDDTTIWPENFDPQQAGAIKIDIPSDIQ